MKKIVVIGTTFVDIKGYPSGEYIPKGRNAGRVEIFHGGVGRNIAEDVANMGGSVCFVSTADDSMLSDGVIARLNGRGINTDYVARIPGGLGTWMAIFNDKGDVEANMSARVDMTKIMNILENSGDEIFADADGILIEGDMDVPVMKKIAELADKHKIDVYSAISNMSIAKDRIKYIDKIRCFICNRQEASQMFGEKVEDAETLLKHMKETGFKAMVVTLDKDGCIFADKISGEKGQVDAAKVEVVDTTGAGDSFFSGVSYGLICGLTLAKACELAIHVASVVIGSEENVYLPNKEG